ncbi:hypothetical protein [Vibrio owensii]|uniref:hypothetical protein n=1 Tax=Vibrio owensii TaxID=696485 RepID=UPI0018F209A3|nr:hypothetical protein [Vibrio owensii]
METCLLLQLGTKDILSIRHEDLTLACEETLSPSDCITKIHSSSSAGNQPIETSEGWVMRYVGRLQLLNDHFKNMRCWNGRDVALFEAFNTENEKDKFVAPGRRNPDKEDKDSEDGYYMAYLIHQDGTLQHSRGGSSSSVCKCIGVTRWTE